MDTQDRVVPSLRKTLFNSTDMIADYGEIALDSILDDGLLKDIPVVGTITSLCKTGYNIHERNLLKQLIYFIEAFNDGTIPEEDLKKHREELEKDPRKSEEELGRVMVLLGNQMEDRQSKNCGKFYKAYVRSEISWGKFCELAEANRRMFLSDYDTLYMAKANSGLDLEGQELYQVDRLVSLGLMQKSNREGKIYWNDDGKEKDYILTSFGVTFCECAPLE